MKRTTVVIPDNLANLLDLEHRRSNRSVAMIIREALVSYLEGEGAQTRRLPFAALGRSGHHDTAREAEAILEREWGHDSDS
ncbi:MAG: CopG family transcriptional regulator [Dehalococcoidia bacterium]|nr:CopG family transcriptional regulator [Dehalococcoidia bacterium]